MVEVLSSEGSITDPDVPEGGDSVCAWSPPVGSNAGVIRATVDIVSGIDGTEVSVGKAVSAGRVISVENAIPGSKVIPAGKVI